MRPSDLAKAAAGQMLLLAGLLLCLLLAWLSAVRTNQAATASAAASGTRPARN